MHLGTVLKDSFKKGVFKKFFDVRILKTDKKYVPWSPDQSSGIFMIENIGHDIKTENTFEEYPIEEATFNNFYIDEQNDGKHFCWPVVHKQ